MLVWKNRWLARRKEDHNIFTLVLIPSSLLLVYCFWSRWHQFFRDRSDEQIIPGRVDCVQAGTVLSTWPLHIPTNSEYRKERRILIGPW